jgi:hypothetical protein
MDKVWIGGWIYWIHRYSIVMCMSEYGQGLDWWLDLLDT